MGRDSFTLERNRKLFNLSIINRQLKDEIVEIMKESNLYNVEAQSTYKRRSSTISSWIHWILDQVEE